MFSWYKLRGHDPKEDFVLCLNRMSPNFGNELAFWLILGFDIEPTVPTEETIYYSINTIFEINGVRMDIHAHALTMNINNQ